MCGLYGRLSKEKKLDMLAFNVLGVANDVRGGDSCGYFIDGKYAYGHETTKLYENFFKEDEGLKTITSAKIALGHDRKASVGGVSLDKAQPVVITKENDPSVVEFVLIHNGTINNHKDLAKKYLQIDEKDSYSDSQIMAYIIYYHGFEVLQEYIGAGAFVIVDYRQDSENPTSYIFKGESQQTYNGKPTEERPLFLAMKQNEIWFSSLRAPLELITWNKNYKIIDLKTNTLFTIKEGNIIDEMEYDRTKIEWKSMYSTSVTPYRGGNYYRDNDDDDYNVYGSYGKNYKTSKKRAADATFQGLHYGRNLGRSSQGTVDTTVSRLVSVDHIIDESKMYTYGYSALDRIYYDSASNRYHFKGTLAEGKIRLSTSGYISAATESGCYIHELYFFQGVIIKSRVAHEFLCNLCAALNVDHRFFYEHYEPIVWAMSIMPRYDSTLNIFQKHILEKDKDENINIQCKLFDGYMPVLFIQTDKIYHIDKGNVVGYVNIYTNSQFFKDYDEHVNDPYDYKEILQFFSTKLLKENDTKED